MLSIIGIDGKRRLEFAEGIAARAEDNSQLVSAWCGVELIFIAIRRLREFFPVVFLQVQIDGVAESRSDRPICPVGDTQHVQVGVILSLFFVELKCIRWDLRFFFKQKTAYEI